MANKMANLSNAKLYAIGGLMLLSSLAFAERKYKVLGIGQDTENIENTDGKYPTTKKTSQDVVLLLEDGKNNVVFTDSNGDEVVVSNLPKNNEVKTDLPAQIKAFVNQNRDFINKTKTIPNLYNVFVTIEKDANTGLLADDISTRFNQAFGNDNPSGDALKNYIIAYNLLTQAFTTDKVAFVNPSPQKVETTEEEDPFADLNDKYDKDGEQLRKELETKIAELNKIIQRKKQLKEDISEQENEIKELEAKLKALQNN